MAKLSDRQKKNILAKWHTGEYSKSDLAKLYKVDEKTIRNITDKQEPQNVDIVEAQTQLELFKKSSRSPIEIAEINKSVQSRLKAITDADKLKLDIYEAQSLAVQRVKELLTSNKKTVAMKLKNGEFDTVEKHEIELSPQDLQTCIDGIDKASITLKVNERHAPRAEVKVTGGDDNSTTNNLTVEQISIGIANGLPN